MRHFIFTATQQGPYFRELHISSEPDHSFCIWGFPKIRSIFSGVPLIRTFVFWGSILGSPYLGKLPFLSLTGLLAAAFLLFGGQSSTRVSHCDPDIGLDFPTWVAGGKLASSYQQCLSFLGFGFRVQGLGFRV